MSRGAQTDLFGFLYVPPFWELFGPRPFSWCKRYNRSKTKKIDKGGKASFKERVGSPLATHFEQQCPCMEHWKIEILENLRFGSLWRFGGDSKMAGGDSVAIRK